MKALDDQYRGIIRPHLDDAGRTIGYWLESVYGDTVYLTQRELDQLKSNLKENGEWHHE